MSQETFLFAGFAALLVRLARQDAVSILRLSPNPAIASFTAEDEISFQRFVETSEVHEVGWNSGDTAGTVGFRFLEESADTTSASEVDLELIVWREAGGFRATLVSRSGLWDAETLQQWLVYLKTLLQAAALDPALPVKHLPLLDEASTVAFYTALNQTTVDFPRDQCAHDLVSRQAVLTPDATAVVFAEQRLSYRELEERSTRLARILREMGAGPGRSVAICMERSADLPMSLLAVLKSGACYVPLDPQNPHQRLRTIVEECQPIAVLSSTTTKSALQFDTTPVFFVDAPWQQASDTVNLPPVDPASLAYIIYTSGTTGQPKGVMIPHRALTNLLWGSRTEPGISSSDRLLAVATISFDIATMDMFLPLIAGATLVVADRHAGSDPGLLAALLAKHQITVLQATPVTWRLLANSDWRGDRDLKMLSGGEALPRELANQLLDLGGELWNSYGPTETTIYSAYLRIQEKKGIVRVGPPMANTTFYVMDEAGRPLPEGVAGELCIGGAGVSLGYLERPELTEQRFIKDPFALDGRLFRTGDLVRVVHGGELEFFGRLDHQVKLRGYRIELGEIETVLRMDPSVKNAVVVLREDTPGEPRLVAYVTQKEGGAQASDLREHTARFLPEYMLPQRIVTLDAIPLTSSGKIDRRALPLPPTQETVVFGVAPSGELETRLLKIFREVLDNAALGVTDNFFDIGGYSLTAVRLFTRIKREMRLELPISLLFDAPTVRELARLIGSGARPPILVPIRPRGSGAPLFIVLSYLIYRAVSEAVEQDRPVYGLREVDAADQVQTLQQRVDLYARVISKVCPEGPLCLAGWCAAGSLTVEIGRRLTEQGRSIQLLALFDAECPGYEQQLLRRSSWKTRLQVAWTFHAPNLRQMSFQAKMAYVAAGFRRQWERLVAVFTTRHHAFALWLRRHFPVLIPAAILDNDFVAITFPEDYQWQPYPGRIVLFRASDAPRLPGETDSLGWKEIALEGAKVEFVPGDHESMFQEPQLQVFGQRLREAIEQGEVEIAARIPRATIS